MVNIGESFRKAFRKSRYGRDRYGLAGLLVNGGKGFPRFFCNHGSVVGDGGSDDGSGDLCLFGRYGGNSHGSGNRIGNMGDGGSYRCGHSRPALDGSDAKSSTDACARFGIGQYVVLWQWTQPRPLAIGRGSTLVDESVFCAVSPCILEQPGPESP